MHNQGSSLDDSDRARASLKIGKKKNPAGLGRDPELRAVRCSLLSEWPLLWAIEHVHSLSMEKWFLGRFDQVEKVVLFPAVGLRFDSETSYSG